MAIDSRAVQVHPVSFEAQRRLRLWLVAVTRLLSHHSLRTFTFAGSRRSDPPISTVLLTVFSRCSDSPPCLQGLISSHSNTSSARCLPLCFCLSLGHYLCLCIFFIFPVLFHPSRMMPRESTFSFTSIFICVHSDLQTASSSILIRTSTTTSKVFWYVYEHRSLP